MTEQWRDIPGYPGYQASSAGRVRSLTRKVRCNNGWRTSVGRILSAFPARATGYLQVEVSGHRESVHRLVAKAWCEGHFDGAHVNHINSNRTDNRSENLEWVTVADNCRHAFRQGGRVNPFQGAMSGDHPTAKAVVSTCIATGEERRYSCASDAVRDGFDSGGISRCCHGKWKSHGGRRWRFADEARPAA